MSFKFNSPECGQKFEKMVNGFEQKLYCPLEPQKIYRTKNSALLVLICLIFVVTVSGQEVETAQENTVENTITVNCFFYIKNNTKIIPHFKIFLFNYSPDLESQFLRCLKSSNNLDKAKAAQKSAELQFEVAGGSWSYSNMKSAGKVSIEAAKKLQDANIDFINHQGNFLKLLIFNKKSLSSSSSSEEGTITFEILPKSYTLFAIAKWGAEDIYWVRHITRKTNATSTTINLTNDNTCVITDSKHIFDNL